MRTCELRTGCLAAALVAWAFLCLPAQAAWIQTSLDYAPVDVASGAMESVFGPQVDELDAAAYGFNFQFKRDDAGAGYDDPMHGFRNLNVISQVFVADHQVTVGVGSGGSTIELQPGDYTFAYTLDYTDLDLILPDSAVQDFQILRTVFSDEIQADNPGARMAVDLLIGGAYNTAAEYGDSGAGTPALLDYPDGMGSESMDTATLAADKLEYDWGSATVDPETTAMVLLFCSPDIDIWQVGWGSEDGQGLANPVDREAVGATGEGGSVVGGGESIPDSIPLLIPVVPEPATLVILAAGGLILIGPGRKMMRRRAA